MLEFNTFINELIKSINLVKNRDKSINSLDSLSEYESNKEEKNSLFLKEEEEYNLLKKEKLILSDGEEPSERFSITSELSQINDKDSFETNLITKRKCNINLNDKNQNTLRRKRGRKRIKNFDKAFHGSNDFDNVQRKIKVHFLNFLINFCNDALVTDYGFSPFTFKYKNYKSKMNVNFENKEELKKSSIIDILNLEISSKFKTFNRFENKILLSKIESGWLNKLFLLNNKELFKFYYNNQNPLYKIVFENKEINLASKTKSFYYLFEKNKDKNLKQKFIETAKNVYLNGNDINGNPFLTKIISSDEKKREL